MPLECDGLADIPTWLGAFGAPTAKRTNLSGSHPHVLFPLFRTLKKADRTEADSVVHERVVAENGRVIHKVTGNKRRLKETQVYPKAYGAAVSRAFRSWRESQAPIEYGESSDSDYDTLTEWPEAELLPVVRFLERQAPNVRTVC